MYYLGLVLDARWTFEDHIEQLAPRQERTGVALCRLLPNIGGPDERARRCHPFDGLVRSPVCAADLMASHKRCAKLASVWRRLAIRVVWGYRTLSHEAPSVLAGLLSLDLLAAMETRTYDLVPRRPSGLPSLGPEEADNIKKENGRSGFEEWRRRLSRQACLRQRAVGAIVPVLHAPMKSGGRRTFRLTQVLSGHACFGQYLNKIGRVVTPGCWFCDADVDIAQYTLEVCPTWTGTAEC
ncbi:uncharacterized protein LOC143220533 [Lasioglossum baleicum]|uniref:uncharacterized protein LOC143220533 n=1 Tax=Lasioglossum baleicum TaxID=434251 RepID=UPI003FCCB94E